MKAPALVVGAFCYYAGMANIVRAEAWGNSIVLVRDDGVRHLGRSTGQRAWVFQPIVLGADAPDPNPGGGDTPGGGTGPVPANLSARDTRGGLHTFGAVQLGHAKGIIDGCNATSGGKDANVYRIALITSIVETGAIWMYANTRRYPETANYPHERDGHDSDSVGLFQQRPAAGWGTPKQCMEELYSTQAFLGQYRNRGLFDIPNWRALTPGQAAQKVQVSAFPDRYDIVVPVANAIIQALVK